MRISATLAMGTKTSLLQVMALLEPLVLMLIFHTTCVIAACIASETSVAVGKTFKV